MAQKADGYPLDKLHGYRLDRRAISELIARMASLPVERRASIPGLKTDRADVTLAGAIVIDAVMRTLGADHIEICAQGVREGALYERLLAGSGDELIDDVRRYGVLNVMDAYRCDYAHCRQVAELALALYGQLAACGLHADDSRERSLLWAAAMLHDVGVAIDYHDHHKHGFYLVVNNGLPGYDHRELALIAVLVRGHRKAPVRPAPFEGLLEADDIQRLARLAACLRAAEQLARSRSIDGVRIERRADHLELVVDDHGDPAVALWSAAQESRAFESAFGHRLLPRAAAAHAGPR